MNSLKEKVEKDLQKAGVEPNEVMGQNFLIREGVRDSIVGAADVNENDIVVEVGAGTGVITQALSEKAGKVIAVEKDASLASFLKEEFKRKDNIQIENRDILKTEPEQLLSDKKQYKIVGNIPYYLTTRLFRHIFQEKEVLPSLAVILLQREVAEKIVAKPPKMTMLAVSVQLYGEPEILQKLPKNAFWPQPEVTSSLLRIKNIKRPEVNEDTFFKVLRAGFSSPRKKLVKNLHNQLDISYKKIEEDLKEVGIYKQKRAQEITLDEWKALAYSLYS